MAMTGAGSELKVEMRPPKLFGTGAMWVINGHGLVLALPFLVTVVFVSLSGLGWWSLVLPLVCMAWCVFLLPIALGNPWVRRRVAQLPPRDGSRADAILVQLTLSPRLRTGTRAMLEDADDFGWISFTKEGVEYQGDSVSFKLPFSRIQRVTRHSIGWRGLFLYGDRLEVITSLPDLPRFEIAERSSLLITSTTRLTRQLEQSLVAGKPA